MINKPLRSTSGMTQNGNPSSFRCSHFFLTKQIVMSYFHKICLDSLILGFIWQLIIMQRVNSLVISVNKEEIKLQITNYLDYLGRLQESNKGLTKYWKMSSLKKQQPATEICNLAPAQLLTLCQWIATSEPYRSKKFLFVRLEQFESTCLHRYFELDNENGDRQLQMVTCPCMKKHFLDYGLKEENLSVHPGVLFVSGNVGTNSALVFISRLRNKQLIYEPYGHVTQIDMAALKKVKKSQEAVGKAIDANVEIENLPEPTDDSDELVEPLLHFSDLL